MARKKEYIEEEVLEKAMNLFWRKGYEATSMKMLEEEMGINKFSIYSGFGNKNGLYVKAMKMYRVRLGEITNKLAASSNGVSGIKQYFYDFIEFAKEKGLCKGCLITNTANEIDDKTDANILAEISKFSHDVKQLFINNLQQDLTKDKKIIEEQADYLLIAMVGLSSASRIFNENQLKNYIENIFRGI